MFRTLALVSQAPQRHAPMLVKALVARRLSTTTTTTTVVATHKKVVNPRDTWNNPQQFASSPNWAVLCLLGFSSAGLLLNEKTWLEKQKTPKSSSSSSSSTKEEESSPPHQQQQQHHRNRPKQKYPSPPEVPLPPDQGNSNNRPLPRPDLPVISLTDVADHADENSLWVTFRGGVYDMTDFVAGHPGGSYRLLMAAGSDLEPYWEVYRQHFRGHVVEFMERYRIGNLSKEDAEKASKAVQFGDIYESDPIRDPNLLPCTYKPFNGEPRIDLLVNDYYTPNELFYVRNHLSCPDIDPKEYVLIVKGKGLKKHKFTLEDLKTKFPKHEVVNTLQCAGNRREDMHGDRKLFFSPHWVAGAISNAKWGGAKMRDVLAYCGLDVDAIALGKANLEGQHYVHFEGYDTDETGFTYGCHIPIEKAVDGLGDAIFAYEMNGEPLPRDHGFPVRAINPGLVGNTNCKWLHKVTVSDKGSSKPYQCKAYRMFGPEINFEDDLATFSSCKFSFEEAPIVYELPVQSMVCNPGQNSSVGMKGATEITLRGVAYAGGGRKVVRVDVSIDGGKTFVSADLHKPVEQARNRNWAWTQFSKTLKLPEDVQNRLRKGEKVALDIVSNAMNSDFNMQPEDVYFNARGVCVNNRYHVHVTLDPTLPKDTVTPNGINEFGNTPTGGKFNEPWGMHGFTSDPKHQSNPRQHVSPEAEHF